VGIVAKLNLTGLGIPPYIPSYLCSIQTGRLAIRLFAIGICGPGDNKLFAEVRSSWERKNSGLRPTGPLKSNCRLPQVNSSNGYSGFRHLTHLTKKLGTKPRPYRTALIDFSFCLSYLVSLIFILNFSGVLFKTEYNDTCPTGRITADTHETPRSNDWSQNNNG
jgi:hypothetical protein